VCCSIPLGIIRASTWPKCSLEMEGRGAPPPPPPAPGPAVEEWEVNRPPLPLGPPPVGMDHPMWAVFEAKRQVRRQRFRTPCRRDARGTLSLARVEEPLVNLSGPKIRANSNTVGIPPTPSAGTAASLEVNAEILANVRRAE
jgi:hypothetical protein